MRLILWDWDGPIADSLDATVVAYNSIADWCGHPRFASRQEFQEFQNPNWKENLRRMGVPESRHAEADEIYRRVVSSHPIPVVAGMPELLDRLYGSFAHAIVSNQKTAVIRDRLAECGLTRSFAAVSAAETGQFQPKTERFLVVAEQLGFPLGACVGIGDVPEDVFEAQAAGVARTIAVTYGWRTRSQLEMAFLSYGAPPSFIVDTPAELLVVLESLKRF